MNNIKLKFAGFMVASWLITGCGGVKQEVPLEPENNTQAALGELNNLSEAEKTEEIQRVLDKIGVALPKNWETMTKSQRGKFLLDYVLTEENIDFE